MLNTTNNLTVLWSTGRFWIHQSTIVIALGLPKERSPQSPSLCRTIRRRWDWGLLIIGLEIHYDSRIQHRYVNGEHTKQKQKWVKRQALHILSTKTTGILITQDVCPLSTEQKCSQDQVSATETQHECRFHARDTRVVRDQTTPCKILKMFAWYQKVSVT